MMHWAIHFISSGLAAAAGVAAGLASSGLSVAGVAAGLAYSAAVVSPEKDNTKTHTRINASILFICLFSFLIIRIVPYLLRRHLSDNFLSLSSFFSKTALHRIFFCNNLFLLQTSGNNF